MATTAMARYPGPGWGRRLLGATLVNMCLGSLYAWSLFVEPVSAAFDRPPSALSGVFSVAVVTFALVALMSGRLVDRASPRATVACAAVAAVAGMLVAARAPSLPWVVVGYGVLFGLANGLGYATAVAVGGKAFGARRGLAVGIIVGAYAAGPLVASPIIATLLDATGWRGTFAALGVGIGAVLLSAAALLGGRLPADDDRGRHEVDRRLLLLHPHGLMIWLGFLLGALPALMVLAHAATIAGAAGLGPAASSAAVALLGAGNVAGRTGGGWVSDRIGRVPGLRTATALLAVACVVLAAVTGTGLVLAALTLVGVSYGAQSSLVPALTADLFGTRRFAANYGQVFTGWGVAGVLGPQAGSRLGDASQGFTTALHLGAASSALALVLYLLMIGRRGSTGSQTT